MILHHQGEKLLSVFNLKSLIYLNRDQMKKNFLDANYILFDPSLWHEAHETIGVLYELPYIVLAEDYFGDKEISPTLIDLNGVDNNLKLDAWEFLGSRPFTDGSSQLDQMSMFQNIIKTDLDIDEMSELIINIMLFNDHKSIFRFYDPRVMMHHYAYKNTELYLQTELRDKFFKLQNSCSDWVVSVCKGFYRINYSENLINFKFNNYNEITNITDDIRQELIRKNLADIPDDKVEEVLSKDLLSPDLFDLLLSKKYYPNLILD